MQIHKLSVSLPQQQINFISTYKDEHACKSRSEVIQKALNLLYQHELAKAYREANAEIDTAFDVTLMDGLTDETW